MGELLVLVGKRRGDEEPQDFFFLSKLACVSKYIIQSQEVRNVSRLAGRPRNVLGSVSLCTVHY